MQLLRNFVSLALFTALVFTSTSNATPLATPGENVTSVVEADEPATYIISDEQMDHWIATTDAEITFVGEPFNPLAPEQTTRVTYCNRRINNVCGGNCVVYSGGATCRIASGTQCLFATRNVGFCTGTNCNGTCDQFSTCRTIIADGFCFTPGTNSIAVGA